MGLDTAQRHSFTPHNTPDDNDRHTWYLVVTGAPQEVAGAAPPLKMSKALPCPNVLRPPASRSRRHGEKRKTSNGAGGCWISVEAEASLILMINEAGR